MKKFTLKEVNAIRRGQYKPFPDEKPEDTLRFITGSGGVFKYEVEPRLQAFIDEKASRLTYVTDKGRWKSVEEARKSYAWHQFLIGTEP